MDKGRLNDTFKNASETVVIFNSSGGILYFNDAVKTTLKYSQLELEEKNLFDLLEKDIHDKVKAFVNQPADKLKPVMNENAYVLQKGNTTLPANLQFSTILHEKGNIHMLVVETLPVSEYTVSHDFKLLANALPELTSVYDDQARCLYVNPAAKTLYGYRQSEYQMMGGIFRFIDKEKKLHLLDSPEGSSKKHTFSYTLIAKDGSSLKAEADIRKVHDRQGKINRLIVTERPIQTGKVHGKTQSSNSATPLILLTNDWRLAFINKDASHLLSYKPTQGDSFYKLLHPDDAKNFTTDRESPVYNGIISTQQQLRFGNRQKYQLLRVVFDIFFDENGTPTYIAARLYPSNDDQAPLPGRSQYIKLVAEHVDDVVCFFRPDFTLKYVSPSVQQTLGYSNQELEGNSIFELIHPDDLSAAKALFNNNKRESSHTFRCKFKKKGNGYLELGLDFRMLDSVPVGNNILPFLALLKHVPHLQDTSSPENLFSQLSQYLDEGLALVALPSLTISRVNSHLVSKLETTESDIIAKSFSIFFQDSDKLERLKELLNKGQGTFREDMHCIGHKQQYFWASVAVSFFGNSDSKFALIRIVDISAQKEREEALNKAREEAEAVLKSREKFLSTMSHEIRTPLNAILGMTHLMLEGEPRADQLKLLQTLKFSGDNLTALINDVLDFSKIEAGKLEFANDDFNLREFLHGIKSTYKNLARDKGLLFRTLVEEDLPEVVNGDVHRLGQIMNNLLNNAVKFTEDGYVILSTYVEKEGEDHFVLLFEVADTGIGIPKEKQDIIFDPYRQASQKTSQYFGGTGLGLSIAKKLVKQAQGEITVSSEEGRGTKFKVKIRVAKTKATTHTQNSAKSSSKYGYKPLDGLKVLYVEDVIPNQFLMEGLCSTWQVELDTALNGLEALSKVKEKQYDLILMDIYMPEMNGYDTTKAIRNLHDSHYQQVPILALSASVSENTRYRIKESGMNDYLAKPVNPKALHQKLEEYSTHSSSHTLGDEPISQESVILESISPDTPDFVQLKELYRQDQEGYQILIGEILKLSKESAFIIKNSLSNDLEEQFRSSAHKIMSYVRLLKLQGLQGLIESIKYRFEVHSQSPQAATKMLETHFSSLNHALEEELERAY